MVHDRSPYTNFGEGIDCNEPFVTGKVADRVSALLRQLKTLHSEVSVVAYAEPAVA